MASYQMRNLIDYGPSHFSNPRGRNGDPRSSNLSGHMGCRDAGVGRLYT